LLHGGRVVSARFMRQNTPMGAFVRKASPHLWGQKGWFPASWPRGVISPGNWPC
jgi:hypothetical protein